MKTGWVIDCTATPHPSAAAAARWRRIKVDHCYMGRLQGWGGARQRVINADLEVRKVSKERACLLRLHTDVAVQNRKLDSRAPASDATTALMSSPERRLHTTGAASLIKDER